MPETLERPRSKLFRRNDEEPMGAITERDIALLRNIGHPGSSPRTILTAAASKTSFAHYASSSILALLSAQRRKKAYWFGATQRKMIYGLS
jgi:hypothetical protein